MPRKASICHVSLVWTLNKDRSFFSLKSSPIKSFLQHKMIREMRSIVFLVTLSFANSQISLDDTNDGLDIQFYDCVRIQSLDYCRRPRGPINLTRDNDTQSCEYNAGTVHRFSELRSENITVDTLVQRWTFTLEQLEQYSLFLNDPNGTDGWICRCSHRESFGKHCEYRLPVGKTFEETLEWQLIMRNENQEKVQIYGDVVCYQTLECNSGMLCLDWREICDGFQQCLEGKDEENCDLLEMNRCDLDDEYRCANGMCIPEEFFLDGDLDCLDWSDERPFNDSWECPQTSVNTECDDHLCPFGLWSCGDGQCIQDRMWFQRLHIEMTCHSRRDQYFVCETHQRFSQWTMSNGRCFRDDQNDSLPVTSRNDEETCEYLLRCVLSLDFFCNDDSESVEEHDRECRLSVIRYPREAVMTPFTFFLFNRTRDWVNKQPDFLLINGTVRCRDALITVREKRIPFDSNWDPRRVIEEYFCRPFRMNMSSSVILLTRHSCHHQNDSTDVCQEWNRCLSNTRIRDGIKNCLNGRDELEQSEVEMEKTCARVRRHRLRCSTDQFTCLGMISWGNGLSECRNRFDELFFGVGRMLSSIGCHRQRQDECFLLRQYISQSSTSTTKNDLQRRSQIPFRFHCDTFSDLPRGEDEDPLECQQWWICPDDLPRCRTGQCLAPDWIDDAEWDCQDASDEYDDLSEITEWTLKGALEYDFTNRSFLVPSSCENHSHPFVCLSSRATEQGFSCFNLSQIGDGTIDCAGGQDERNTLQLCSQSVSSLLGHHFLCPSTNTCIPFYFHCWKDEFRCPRRSDDELWCFRERRPENCFDENDFVCFDGQCFKGGRCNRITECPFNEDEYMCDYITSFNRLLVPYRDWKRFSRGRRSSILRFSRYPSDMNTTHFRPQSPSVISPTVNSLSPYWCNRGLGVLSTSNRSTVLCFCPPQYYGDKCEFHSDRLSVVLHLDLSEFFPIDRKVLLQLVVLFLFNDEQVLMRDQFRLHPSREFDSLLNINRKKKTKLISHFIYPRSATFLHERRQTFFNRSSLLARSPFSIRVELYQTRLDERPSMIAIWKYPLSFTHLPVSRLAKILRFDRSSPHRSPCLANPCHPNEQCRQLMNNRSGHICLCRENCSEQDEECLQGYCTAPESLCRSSLRRNAAPFCLCPLNRYGRRCSIEHDACLSNPCRNNGSCFPDRELDRVICVCRKEYFGSRCELKRTSIQFSLSTDLPHRGVVLQVLQIDLSSLELILLQQKVFLQIPRQMEYYHQDQSLITGIVLAKVYSSSEVSVADLYLLSVYEKIFSINGRTNLSSINRCEHRRIFSSYEDSSPIRYHHICITNRTRLCFRDDFYLCLCTDNRSRVECFNYDDQLDRCELCRANGRCLQGDSGQSNDFVCVCPACHSGRQCQFNTKSFSFTLDQLFSPDLLSDQRRTTPISLLIFFSLFTFFLALPNNLFSMVTLRRRSCLRYGVGHYLLWMSIINQLSLALLLARLLHLILNITGTSSLSSTINDLLCKSLNYLLSSSTRMVYWLTSLVSIERLYTTLFLRGQWLKQPRIARRLIVFTGFAVLISDLYELFFYKSFSTQTDELSQGSICVLDISSEDQFLWTTFHLLFLILHSLLPFLINLFSTISICLIVINKKIKTSKKTDPSQYSLTCSD